MWPTTICGWRTTTGDVDSVTSWAARTRYDYNAWFQSNVKRVAWRAATLRYRGVFTRKSLGYLRRYLRLRVPYIDLSPYPAHLHINTRADRRGNGIGTRVDADLPRSTPQ